MKPWMSRVSALVIAACASIGAAGCYGSITARPGGYYRTGYHGPGYQHPGYVRGGPDGRPSRGAVVVVQPPRPSIYVAPAPPYNRGGGPYYRGGHGDHGDHRDHDDQGDGEHGRH